MYQTRLGNIPGELAIVRGSSPRQSASIPSLPQPAAPPYLLFHLGPQQLLHHGIGCGLGILADCSWSAGFAAAAPAAAAPAAGAGTAARPRLRVLLLPAAVELLLRKAKPALNVAGPASGTRRECRVSLWATSAPWISGQRAR